MHTTRRSSRATISRPGRTEQRRINTAQGQFQRRRTARQQLFSKHRLTERHPLVSLEAYSVAVLNVLKSVLYIYAPLSLKWPQKEMENHNKPAQFAMIDAHMRMNRTLTQPQPMTSLETHKQRLTQIIQSHTPIEQPSEPLTYEAFFAANPVSLETIVPTLNACFAQSGISAEKIPAGLPPISQELFGSFNAMLRQYPLARDTRPADLPDLAEDIQQDIIKTTLRDLFAYMYMSDIYELRLMKRSNLTQYLVPFDATVDDFVRAVNGEFLLETYIPRIHWM